jgi:hypothetical protein
MFTCTEAGARYEALRADAVHTQEKFDGAVTLGDAAAPLNVTAKFRGKGSLECRRKSLTVAKPLCTRPCLCVSVGT